MLIRLVLVVSWLFAANLASGQCVGDCDRDGVVSINEIVTGVQMALAQSAAGECAALDVDADGIITISELIAAVSAALDTCPANTNPTPTASPSPRASGGFNIDGCVNEFPGEPCGQNFATVRLDPPGLTSTIGADLRFHFTNIPAGTYVLSVLQQCNPYGCWNDVPVTITDHDVFVHIDLTTDPTPTALNG